MATWGGFNDQNIWDYGYGQDLMPLVNQYGGERDNYANERDAYLQPWEQKYNSALQQQGRTADATSANLTSSPEFKSFVQSGGQLAPLPANASPTQQWNAQPTPQALPGAPQLAGGGYTGGLTPTASPSVNTGPTAGTGDDLIAQLMQRAQQSITPSRTDPTIRAQADAYSANVDRASRNYVSDVAEREGPYGNIEGYRRMAAERAGQASGAFEAELLGREQDARRGEVQNALGQWGGLLSGDLGMGLQRELGYMNNDQRTQDRNQQMDQFLRELALRQYDTTNRWDYNWLFGGA